MPPFPFFQGGLCPRPRSHPGPGGGRARSLPRLVAWIMPTPRAVDSLLVVVPARGGSKGLPGKNVVEVAGAPLVCAACFKADSALDALRDAYVQRSGGGALAVAEARRRFKVVCSTDADYIADACTAWGFEVLRRPDKLATDAAGSDAVIGHAITALRPPTGESWDGVALLQCTVPGVTAANIETCLRAYEDGRHAVCSCKETEPLQWHYQVRRGETVGEVPQLVLQDAGRRQDYGPTYLPSGAIWVASDEHYRQPGGFYASPVRFIDCGREQGADIDDADDLLECKGAALQRAESVEPIELGGKRVGPGCPCLIIAEGGVNHNGDIELAKNLIDVAADGGADVVKFQTFRADKLASASAPKAEYQKRTTASEESQHAMLKKLELSKEDHKVLMAHAKKRGILFMSTPFDPESCEMLVELGVPAIKLGSGNIDDRPTIQAAGRSGLPLLMSTGMSSMKEVLSAVHCARKAGSKQIALFHCVSNYPADPEDCNLLAMRTIAAATGCPCGYSDHTDGDIACLTSVAMGACMIEKHITTDQSLPGPDHRASMEPEPFKQLCEAVRRVEAMRGTGRKEMRSSESDTRSVARKSIAAGRDIKAGELIEEEMLIGLRPGTGISCMEHYRVVGRRAARDIAENELVKLEDLKDEAS